MKQKLTFQLDYREGHWFITSPDVTGLYLWGDDIHRLMDNLPPVVNVLRRENKLDIAEMGGRRIEGDSVD